MGSFLFVCAETGTKQKTEEGAEKRGGERGIAGEGSGEEIVARLSKT